MKTFGFDEMMKLINLLIDSILVKVEDGPVTLEFNSTELFNSCSIPIPHDSELLQVEIEIEISKDKVKYKTIDRRYGDDTEDEEEITLNDLTISQLSLIHEKLY